MQVGQRGPESPLGARRDGDERNGSVLNDHRERPHNPQDTARSLADLVDKAAKRIEAFSESLRTLWTVRKDRAQLAVRRRMQSAALLGTGALAGGVALIYGVILLVGGTARGLGHLFGDRAWLGDLVTGVLFIGVIGGGLAGAFRRWDRVQLVKQQKKYAELHRKRRASSRDTAAH